MTGEKEYPIVSANASKRSCCRKHHSALLNLLSKEMGVEVADIVDFELCLADNQPAAIGGVYNEFIFSPRLDNLMSSYTAMEVGITEWFIWTVANLVGLF